MFGNKKFIYFIRIVAGVYLVYIAVTLIEGIMKGEVDNPVMMGIAAAVFMLSGAFFAVSSVVYLVKHAHDEPAQDEPGPDEEPADTNAAAIEEDAEQKLSPEEERKAELQKKMDALNSVEDTEQEEES